MMVTVTEICSKIYIIEYIDVLLGERHFSYYISDFFVHLCV